MNRAFLVILFLHLGAFIYAQMITGLVLDQETREPVDFASVFFRSLWINSLKASGFSVSTYRTGDALNYELIVFQDFNGSKSLQYNQDLQIRYYDHLSYISFREYKVIFEQDGYFDPTPIIWTWTMSKQRIADFLPYEYLLSE